MGSRSNISTVQGGAGILSVETQAGAILARSAVASWRTFDWVRCVVFYTWNPVTQAMDLIVTFFQNPADGATRAEVIGVSMPSAGVPNRVRIGAGGGGAEVDYDSVRLFVGNAEYPPPVAPVVAKPTVNHVYSCTGDPSSSGFYVSSLVTDYPNQLKLAYSLTVGSDGNPNGTIAYAPLVSPIYGGYTSCTSSPAWPRSAPTTWRWPMPATPSSASRSRARPRGPPLPAR